MRLKNSRLKRYKLFKHEVKRNDEGGVLEGYSEIPLPIFAEIWPATGKVQAEIYGTRLAYILNMLCYDNVCVEEKDAIAVYNTNQPDYKVISIKRWSEHLQIELEAIRGVNV